MPNAVTSLYRKYLADTGQTDDTPDYSLTQAIGDWARQNNPALFDKFPDFGQEYGAIREANAGSLSAEFGRALKSGSQGLASTALGGAALLTGSDYLREKAQSFDADAAANAPTVGTLEDIAPGRSGIGSLFSKDTARYAASKLGSVVPSIAEAGVTALAGSALGSAIAPGPGTVAGAAEGIVARGLIKSAIRSMLKKGVAEELVASGVIPEASEVALEQAVKQSVPKVTDLVGREAMAIGAKRGLAVTNLANSYLLNAGDVYSEGADRPTTMALGLVAAIPDSILPTYVVGRLFPGVATSKAIPLAKAFLGDRATKLLKAAGIVGVEGGTEYFQEAVDVVARNLKEGKDALTFTPADYRRFREAGIAGVFGGALAAPTEFIEPSPTTVPAGQPTAPAPEMLAGTPAQPAVSQVIPPGPPTPASIVPSELGPVGNALRESAGQIAADRASGMDVARQMAGDIPGAGTQPTLPGAPTSPQPAAPPVNDIARQMAGTIPDNQIPLVAPQGQTPTELGAIFPGVPHGTEVSESAPAIVPAAPEPQKNFLSTPASTSPDVFGSPEKRAQVQAAVQIPGVTYQYSIFKLGEGIPDYAQIDIVNPEGTNSIASTNLDQLRALGVNLPTIPASLPQGKYTVEQVRAATPSEPVAQPAAAVPTPPPDAVVPQPAAPAAAIPFEHGAVVVGEPSLDFRNTPLAEALTPEQWVQAVQHNLNQGKRGSHESSKADTRIAVALQAPDGRVIVTGVTIPSRTLDARGATAVKEPTLQRMGVDDGGKRMVQPSGNKPALLREVVQAGYKPLAVLHFDAEPGKIHQTFADQQAFDKAWGATEKTTGRNIQPAEIRGNVTASAQTEAQLRDQAAKLGDEWLRADPTRREELRQEIRDLYTKIDRVSAQNQQQAGDQGLPPEYRRGGDAGAAIEAGKSGQFNTVMANLMQLGAKVDLVSREILAQNTAQELQRRYTANEQEANASTDPLVKRELARRNYILLERMQAVGQASGVTYSPWHFSLAMKDIGNASMDELVTLLHEASENLTMRLTVEQRGAVQTAIGRSLIQLRGRQLGASQETNVRRSSETGHADLLAETLAQEFAADGIPDAPSLAQAIVRWVKDLYYRAAMALQAGFGAQPSPELALKWFENQLAREVGGDFQYRFANLLDQYLPSPLQERVRRFEGRTGTPGGVSDFLDPVSGIIQQPGVETLNRNALDWDMQFRTAANAGAELDIPDPEARARMKGAVINGLLDFYTKLKEQVAPDATWEDFFIQIKRSGEEDPKLLLGALEQKFPGSSAAQVGGERMTAQMNREAQVELWSRFRKFGLSLRRKAAQATKSIAEASKQVTENAQDINRMEADLRNASLHEDRLRLKAKELVRDLAQSFARGRDTAELQGSLAEAIRQEEKLTESDPIPDAYRQVLGSLYDGTTPVFDYIRAIAQLDLPLSEMTTAEVVRAIKGGGELNPALANLGDNRPLMVALATLARKNADQVDQIQLGWLRDTSMFRQIHGQLEEIKGATAVQLRELDRQFSEHGKASGLAARLKASYLSKRRKQQAASDRVARAEERQSLMEKALGPVDQRTETAAQDAGGAQYEWAPEEGAKWTAMRQDEEGDWRRTERTLHFNPDGSAVEGDQLRQDLASNLAWLRARAAEAGKPRYNQITAQTYALQLLDAKGQQQRTWNGAILNGIDRFVKTPIATVRGLGGPAMQRIIQMLNRYQFIQRNYQRSLEAPATEWQHEFVRLRNSSGLKDNGDFINQVYKPAMYFLAVNPGLEEGPAIRQAAALARRSLANPSEDFNERFASFLRKTKETEDKLLAVAEQYGVFVADKRLGPELRRAVARGWLTGMRSLNGGLVDVLTKDMAQAGWKADTFSVIDPANVPDKAARDQSFEILGQTEALQPLLARLFTPAIIGQWLEPFIAKPGQEPFSYGGDAIPQASVQEAWAEAKGDVLGWIDALGRKLDLQPDKEGHDPVALFRLSMLRNLNGLYNHEAKLAADASQVPGLLDPHGPKPHALMDARVSDLLPPEHVEFATYEPETMHRLVARVAYHGAFGRNAIHIQQAFRETMSHLQGQQAQFQTLASLHTSKAGRVAEAVARGWNYAELESASRRYRDAKDFQTQLESVLGVSANSGPLGDFQKGMALLNFVSGQIVDNPKTAAYNMLSPVMRPFVQRSLGPTAITQAVRTYGDLLHDGLGGLFQSFGLHLFKAAKYGVTIGNSEGRAFSNLSYGVVLSDIGHAGDNQAGANKWLVKPLRLARNIQRKGVQLGAGEAREFPRLALIPGLGVMNSISQIEVQAGGARLAQEFEQLVKDGADYFASHPDAANNPNFRFKPSDLYRFKLDYPLFDWWRQKSVEYGLGNIEDVVRDSAKRRAEGPNANLLTEDQAVTLSMMNQNEFNGNSSINTTPAWLMTNTFLRMAMPLMRWPLWMMSAVHEAAKPRAGENAVKPMLRAIGTLALWNLPIGLAFSLLMDEYDKKLLGKKSNLPNLDKRAAIPLIGLPLSLLTSDHPISQLESMLVRSARAGNIYGLGADIAAQTVAGLDPATGQRAFSLDQRVLAMSQFLNLQQALRNYQGQGYATWGSVAKPVIMAIGGNGVLHAVDLANNLLGLDNAESRLTERSASSNWIRSAAQELDIPIKAGGGFAGVPTPMSGYTREMYLAALANDRVGFLDNYRRALNAAREAVAGDSSVPGADREKEAAQRVLASWKSRNPMGVLATKPTDVQVRQILSIMEPEGQQSVRDALSRFDTFTTMIAPSPIDRYFNRQLAAQRSQMNPDTIARRATGGSLLFSTR